MSNINVTVRCIAYGGKFIGKGMNFALVSITNYSTGQILASGKADQYNTDISGDGSGILRDIMTQPYLWGTPINPETAASFTASIPVTTATQLLISAVVNDANGNALGQVSFLRWVFPGVDMTGKRAFQAVIQGLAAKLLPAQPGKVASPISVSAYVTMMCGCKIDNVNWAGDDFDVEAYITLNGHTSTVPMIFQTTPPGTESTFSALWTPQSTGTYTVNVTVVQRSNGNTAVATGTLVVN